MHNLYGLTLEEYDEMLVRQSGRCAICKTKQCFTGFRFAVDHDHTTGAIRGLLCRRCNQVLGQLGENPQLFEEAANYLRRSGYAQAN